MRLPLNLNPSGRSKGKVRMKRSASLLLWLLACDPRAAAVRAVLKPDDDAALKVWVYRSADGDRWSRDPAPVAWN